MEIKRIDFSPENFNLDKLELTGKSGKVYKSQTLTAGRFPFWEKAWLKAQYNMNTQETFKTCLACIDALKKNDVFTCSTNLYKLVEGVARISDGKHHYMLELMCCFFNADDEDITTLNETMLNAKMDDLAVYDASDLFLLAGLLTPGIINDYEESKKAISENQSRLSGKTDATSQNESK